MNVEIGTIITIATIIFSAGIVYNKVNTLEKKVSKLDGYGERILKLETEMKFLKQPG